MAPFPGEIDTLGPVRQFRQEPQMPTRVLKRPHKDQECMNRLGAALEVETFHRLHDNQLMGPHPLQPGVRKSHMITDRRVAKTGGLSQGGENGVGRDPEPFSQQIGRLLQDLPYRLAALLTDHPGPHDAPGSTGGVGEGGRREENDPRRAESGGRSRRDACR